MDIIAGARLNFIKIAPITRETLSKGGEIGFHFRLIHTEYY